MLCAVDTYKQVYHQRFAQFLNIEAHPLQHRVIIYSIHKDTIYRIYHLIKRRNFSISRCLDPEDFNKCSEL